MHLQETDADRFRVAVVEHHVAVVAIGFHISHLGKVHLDEFRVVVEIEGRYHDIGVLIQNGYGDAAVPGTVAAVFHEELLDGTARAEKGVSGLIHAAEAARMDETLDAVIAVQHRACLKM